jgi:hypothetical protein
VLIFPDFTRRLDLRFQAVWVQWVVVRSARYGCKSRGSGIGSGCVDPAVSYGCIGTYCLSVEDSMMAEERNGWQMYAPDDSSARALMACSMVAGLSDRLVQREVLVKRWHISSSS